MQFCWGMASSMVFSLLPIFIVNELNCSCQSFGALEGTVVFLSFMAKLFAGFLMDVFRRKLPMLKVGAVFTVFSKLFLACAPSIFIVFVAKSIDYFSKGLRHAPSDTILAELSTRKGFAYSFRYTMNIAGFLLGSILTSSIVALAGQNFRLIFSLAILPTIAALYILKYKIEYPDEQKYKRAEKHKWRINDIVLMPKSYWRFMIFITMLMFNRFSEGFITLRAKEVLPDHIGNFPLFMGIYELFALCIALVIGRFSDHMDKRKLMFCGMLLLIVADVFGIFANGLISVVLVYMFAGMHIGMTQGLIGSIIARLAPQHLLGTAFAISYGVEGISLLLSNTLAGISPRIASFLGLNGTAVPFVLGSVFSIFSAIYLTSWMKKEKFSAI